MKTHMKYVASIPASHAHTASRDKQFDSARGFKRSVRRCALDEHRRSLNVNIQHQAPDGVTICSAASDLCLLLSIAVALRLHRG